MSINEVTNKLNTLGSAWDQFRKVNDARVEEIERKGNSDPLFMEQLTKIGNVLDGQKSRLDMIETAHSRPAREMKNVRFDGNMEHKKAYESYLRKGNESELQSFEKKSLTAGVNADGGYTVTPQLSDQITAYVNEFSPMRQLASVEQVSTGQLDIIVDNGASDAGWVAETDARPDTTTPQVQKKSIVAFELYAQPNATQRLIDDSAIDIESWIAEKVSQIFAVKENTAFISGNGTTQPKGILGYTAGTSYGQIEQINSGTSAVITFDGLIKLVGGLKEDYLRNATFLMNRASIQAIRTIKDTTGQYIWQPGMALGNPDTLMGIPVRQAVDMPVQAAASLSVVLADFKRAYKIVDHLGVRILRDPFTSKPFVRFYTTKRVGGEVVNFEAIKILKLS